MSSITISFIGARGHHSTVLGELERIPDVRIAGVSPGGDSIEPIVNWCRQHGQEPRVFQDYREMLDRSEADLVVICGPFERHAEMCLEAIARHIHVLTEKPAALTFADLNRLKTACRQHPRVLVAGMMFSRYDTGFFTAWKMIGAGAIGEIRLINARKSYKLATRPAYYESRQTYGGTIPWVGSHAIDWMLWIGGQSPRSVWAAHSTVANGNHGEMESSAMCQFSFASGMAASISLDILRPASAPTHGDDWIRFVGSAGVMEVRPNSIHLINADNDGSKPVAVSSDRFLLMEIVEQIRGGKPCMVDTASTLTLTDACLRARQSADENRVIEFCEEFS